LKLTLLCFNNLALITCNHDAGGLTTTINSTLIGELRADANQGNDGSQPTTTKTRTLQCYNCKKEISDDEDNLKEKKWKHTQPSQDGNSNLMHCFK
jgi:hypothetical protein